MMSFTSFSMSKISDVTEMARGLSGLQTVESIARTLKIQKNTAINYIYRLRKHGLVQTDRLAGKKHLYKVFPVKPVKKGVGLYGFINQNSKVQVVPRYEVYLHNKLTIEEAVVKALETKDFRTVLASLGLYRKITNWPLLKKLAEKAKVKRQVGALYELAKTTMRVKRADKRTLNGLRTGKGSKYVIEGLKSKDFKKIEKKWRVYLPFNKKDLEEYDD